MKKQHADYLLLGGTVIDPVCERSFRADVAVGGGKILAIGADLAYEAAKTLDVSGCYVTPGLIDMHCHCYPTFPFAHDSLPTIHPDVHNASKWCDHCWQMQAHAAGRIFPA